jgi:hypothetical protein
MEAGACLRAASLAAAEESRWVMGRMEVPSHRGQGVVGEKGEGIRDRFQAIHTEQEDHTGSEVVVPPSPSSPSSAIALGAPAAAVQRSPGRDAAPSPSGRSRSRRPPPPSEL